MKIKEVENCPKGLRYFEDDGLETKLKPKDIEDIVEIFQTPLTGSYNWDYTAADTRLSNLYELGKKLNWNATLDLDWSKDHHPHTEWPTNPEFQQLAGFKPYDDLSEEKKIECAWHLLASGLSQIVHGEQGALLVASQLVSCAPTYNAKLYAASQTFDEARHVEVFNKYLQTRSKTIKPIGKELKALLDKILTDHRWDFKFIGMQIIIEGLALAIFDTMRSTTNDPVLKRILTLVIRDEARHVTFGVNYLESYVKTLTNIEIQEREDFCLQACTVMRNRFKAYEVWEKYGFDLDYTDTYAQDNTVQAQFQHLLFNRIMPNLKKIGLLPDRLLPKYDILGVTQHIDGDSDFETSWEELSKPLEVA